MRNFRNYNNPDKHNGFTLVELMVSIVLALFLAIVAGQSYVSTKTTYRATEQNARIQENLRFATHFINREVRQAGNIGCFQTITSHLIGPDTNFDRETIRGLYDFRQPVNVWRYQQDDNFDLSSNAAYSVPALARNQWNDADARRRPLRSLDNQVMRGSDLISVTKISEPLGIRLSDINNLNSDQLNVQQLNGNTIPTGQVLLVGDCNSADLFVHTGAQQDGTTGVLERGNSNLDVRNNLDGSTWQKNWDSSAEVRLVESTIFFIGQGASNLPALFKLDLGLGGSAQPLEIVDGIEFMRALVGLDSNDDNVLDQYARIDEIGGIANYPNIRSLQIGLLAVGDENTSIDAANNRTFQLTQRHQVTSPDSIPPEFSPNSGGVDDTRYRQSTTTTIELRNAGLRRKPEVFDFL